MDDQFKIRKTKMKYFFSVQTSDKTIIVIAIELLYSNITRIHSLRVNIALTYLDSAVMYYYKISSTSSLPPLLHKKEHRIGIHRVHRIKRPFFLEIFTLSGVTAKICILKELLNRFAQVTKQNLLWVSK